MLDLKSGGRNQVKRLIGYQIMFLLAFIIFGFAPLHAQKTVDKMVATVSDGVRPTELITYSDLLWQMALQKDTPLSPPSAKDLEETLQNVINQRLLALEAERLPTAPPTKSDIDKEIRRIIEQFPTASVFVERLRLVGFTSIEDPNFVRLMERRVATEKYLEFRFRSFVVITPEDEQNFYNETFVPRFRETNPNAVVPPIEQVRTRINQELTEDKIANDIEKFLQDAKERDTIIYLSPVGDVSSTNNAARNK